jgi:signal transduction histidine kinase/CHASE2 domain-containing sensor protein
MQLGKSTGLNKQTLLRKPFAQAQTGWRFFPGLIAGVLVGGLWQLGMLQPLDQQAYKTLFQVRGALPWDQRVVVIAMDDKSLKTLGRLPWSRDRYTKLLNTLTPAQPDVIVLDLIFPEASKEDGAMAKAMERQGRVVLAQAWDRTGQILQPTPQLRHAAIATGHVLIQEDSDGLSKTFIQEFEGVPTLSVSTLRVYSIVHEPIDLPPNNQRLWLNWPGPAAQATQYSFADVLSGKVPPQTFQNKIVLIGSTATALEELRTPYDSNPPASSVFLHAAFINNLLQSNFLHPLPSSWIWILLLCGGPLLSYSLSSVSAGKQLIIWVSLSIFWLVLSLIAFRAEQVVAVVEPIALFAGTGIAIALRDRSRVNALLAEKVEQLLHLRNEASTPVYERGNPIFSIDDQQSVGTKRVAQLAELAEWFSRNQSAKTAIANSLSMGLVAADFDGTVWFCNAFSTRWLPLNLGGDLSTQMVPAWLSLEQWKSILSELRSGKSPLPSELCRETNWYELKFEPLSYFSAEDWAAESSDQSVTGFLLVIEEITARKIAEEERNQQLLELQRLNSLKDDFLSTVSHELRTPMANMKMALHLIERASTDKQRDAYLAILQQQCTREIALINDLLNMQRLEMSAETLRLEPVDLIEWLPKVIVPFAKRADQNEQSLRLEVPDDLPLLMTDRSHLERILAELLNNACKYTPPRERIYLSVCPKPATLDITVMNTGSEIAQAEWTRIFEKFYRVPESDRWNQGGTGLGLALVKGLAEHLGGTIQVVSNANKTAFTVQLPLREIAIQNR